MSFFNSEIVIPTVERYLPLVGIRPYSHETVEFMENMEQRAIDVVEEELEGKEFLVGERISLADYFCAGILTLGFQVFYGRAWRERNGNVARWYQRVARDPLYAAVTARVDLLEEPKLRNVAPEDRKSTRLNSSHWE